MFFWQHNPKICVHYILLINASHSHVFVVIDFVFYGRIRVAPLVILRRKMGG